MGIVSLSEQAIAKNKAKNEDSQLTIKEVGYLLQLVESSKHDGQALELALDSSTTKRQIEDGDL